MVKGRSVLITVCVLAVSFFFASCLETTPANEVIAEVTTTTGAVPKKSVPASSDIDTIINESSCTTYKWKERGAAPKSYIKGIAATFAKALCFPEHAKAASVANTGNAVKDALAHYKDIFASHGMDNSRHSTDTLRHTYTLLMGLGMRESSGRYCCGRDGAASNTSSDSAEAGVFQTSYDSRYSHPGLADIYNSYKTSTVCLLESYKEGISCSESDLKTWGTGEGAIFQKLSKNCPAFATEYAAVMLRYAGGSKGHYGPLRTKAAEIVPACDQLLQKVQQLVESDKTMCNKLR